MIAISFLGDYVVATKKRKEQLESLLDWEREGDRLFEIKDLFNRQIAPELFLYEMSDKVWNLAFVKVEENGGIKTQNAFLKHATLIQLGLTILEAIKQTEDRFLKG
jgi:hypothetical protein